MAPPHICILVGYLTLKGHYVHALYNIWSQHLIMWTLNLNYYQYMTELVLMILKYTPYGVGVYQIKIANYSQPIQAPL